jgi:UDP-N-acetylmuramyl tripeptide synthase
MKFEFYEVWTEDSLGHQELADTTSSIVEARIIAKQAIDDGAEYVTIYRESDSGDLELVEEL